MLWLLLAVAGLLGAARLNEPLRELRKAYHISQADPLENAPPLVAFTTVAFGGFRGIVADLLWLRATRLQEEGKVFELVQLADWITKLEPRFTAVWAFHAWNLAYNVSVLFDQPEDRWRWVSHGIRLLRNGGLVYNPGDARLLYELAWLFQHKLGGNMDKAHLYYKRAWAAEMMTLFDGPRPDYVAYAAPQDPVTVARAHRMSDEYKLDPALMQIVDAQYGPLDWRLPQAHAIYWAWRSRQLAKGFDVTMANRMLFQSLTAAFSQGRLFFDPYRNIFIPSPNPDLLPRVMQAFADALAESPDNESMLIARQNFMRDAVVLLYASHREADARSLYEEMNRLYPPGDPISDFESFVHHVYIEDATELSNRDAAGAVENAIHKSLYWQALGDEDRAAGYDQLARLIWTRAAEERDDLPALDEIRDAARERLDETF
jgi:hypothetical protein